MILITKEHLGHVPIVNNSIFRADSTVGLPLVDCMLGLRPATSLSSCLPYILQCLLLLKLFFLVEFDRLAFGGH